MTALPMTARLTQQSAKVLLSRVIAFILIIWAINDALNLPTYIYRLAHQWLAYDKYPLDQWFERNWDLERAALSVLRIAVELKLAQWLYGRGLTPVTS